MKVLALDYGSARTGVAVSDPTGTVARPVGVVERAGEEAGLSRIAELVREHEAERSARSAYEAARDEYRLHLRGDLHSEPEGA